MSEISKTKNARLLKLLEVSRLTIKTGNARAFFLENESFIPTVIPSDFITLFDELVKENYSIEELKTCSNKILNLFFKPIDNYKRIEPEPDTFLDVLEQNNREMEQILNDIRPVFKAFIKKDGNKQLISKLIALFEKLETFAKHYVIKENVLFPIIEESWPDYRCLQIMWSFHDDIRRNIKTILEGFENGIEDMKEFKRSVGDVFFNMLTIKFREEKILFPYILSTISEELLMRMNREGFEIRYPFIQPSKVISASEEMTMNKDVVNLGTGSLSLEQIVLIFNHLPLDITYVDENDRVRYFSTPEKRIFPRTAAIIGREVKNCHPPESVHVVERIVQSFKNEEKDKAEFWIRMKGELILIRYFAVRDEMNNYKGVIEVSQEISDIKSLEGEKSLLDW